jgi:uncharacterized protein yddK
MKELKINIEKCIHLLKGFNINYNTMVGPRTCALVNQINVLLPYIRTKYPKINDILNEANNEINHNGLINAYAFGSIRATLRILESLELTKNKKVFISHSSNDKDIVEKFVDHILQLGIGIKDEDIFCTSIENMGVKNGEDIRRHIQTNIRNADYAFLLISKNYKASEICINEMGAVWAYDANVRLYLLPDVDFDKIGWLCDTRKADMINSSIALDALHKEVIEYFGLPDKGTEWSRQREVFLEYMK